MEDALRRLCPHVKLSGNDVVDLPVLTGRFLMGSDHGGVEFIGDWEKLNETPSRILSLFTLNKYSSTFSPARLKKWSPYICDRVLERVEDAYETMAACREFLDLDSFSEVDMLDSIWQNNAEALIGTPPYTSKYLDSKGLAKGSFEWEPPMVGGKYMIEGYLEALMNDCMDTGKAWCLVSTQKVPGYPVLGVYFSKSGQMYMYGEPTYEGIKCHGDSRSYLFPKRVSKVDLIPDAKVDIHPIGLSAYSDFYGYYMDDFFDKSFDLGYIALLNGKMIGGFGFSPYNGDGINLVCTTTFSIIVGGRPLAPLLYNMMLSNEVNREILYRTFCRHRRVVALAPHGTARFADTGFRTSGYEVDDFMSADLNTYEAEWSGKSMDEIYLEWLS